ncbi:MAG TPA: IclR family transcriptional regulator C-terminal domain-containing protein [Victivallales bacterium]|nr:IclR family transcriptional regulator C-terminal domain-containing protein [Victivallales bacterium]HRR06841.1 IclR family transcriptional regulator C-terminal domain-containing protein [Victivallales bacterium]HRR28717.1 IclR family transcriptional regulator C-terminal domain-containing protein [Victivallales bacterium]HRU00881.1 IclR family transcriptional regulator C-terminal domain-containing protein [Victivallales bacterium]
MENSIKSVKKALLALDFIIEKSEDREGVGLGEIAAHLKINNSTARNILKTMEECGYLGRGPGRIYCPGAKCIDMSRNIFLKRLVTIAGDMILEIARETGESFVLASIKKAKRVVLFRASGDQVIRVDTERAESEDIYKLVTMRIFIAYMSRNELEFFISKNGFPNEKWNMIDNRVKLEAELELLRMQGYADDQTKHYHAFAVPIFGENEKIIASLGAYIPSFRATTEQSKKILELMINCSRKISKSL